MKTMRVSQTKSLDRFKLPIDQPRLIRLCNRQTLDGLKIIHQINKDVRERSGGLGRGKEVGGGEGRVSENDGKNGKKEMIAPSSSSQTSPFCFDPASVVRLMVSVKLILHDGSC